MKFDQGNLFLIGLMQPLDAVLHQFQNKLSRQDFGHEKPLVWSHFDEFKDLLFVPLMTATRRKANMQHFGKSLSLALLRMQLTETTW